MLDFITSINHMALFTGGPIVFIFTLLWVTISIAALFHLRQRPLSELTRVLWVALVIGVPFLGAIALAIVQPRGEDNEARAGDDVSAESSAMG